MPRRAPAVFVGHGSPLNALADNAYTRALARLGQAVGKPPAVLCVSAHWTTRGVWATHMERPRTIHDFAGFPQELFDVDYPAPGSPETAEASREAAGDAVVGLDDGEWGLDHGAWSVLRRMYPEADVPIVQLSVDPSRPGPFHLELGRRLSILRERGVLLLGSGNVVHNLARMDWSGRGAPAPWAAAFDEHVRSLTEDGPREELAADPDAMPGGSDSVPTPEHWLPYLFALGAAAGDAVRWEHAGIEHASISMRCASFGRG
ncbi:MAG: 4,5-DOPA dioxygenase extradiol [Elusimicrobia bacterium]|nr:4,5-DOPA dioxygenase extradiol [Elusimicrobiota bacterium]